MRARTPRSLVPLAALCALVLGASTAPGLAHAQDTGDPFIFDEEEDDALPEEETDEDESSDDGSDAEAPTDDSTDPAPADDDDWLDDDEDLPDFEDDPFAEEGEGDEEPVDLLGEDGGDEDVLAPGTDNASIYRAREDEVAGLPADEEVMAWEAYLQEYPDSIFRDRIERRVDLLLESQFRMRIDRPGDDGVDAQDRELLFTVPMHMTNINPRTKLQGGFEFGFPTFVQANLDFEYAFLRNLSVHGGVWGRYEGWGLETGVRYAFVKSARQDLVATLIGDMRVNFGPVFFEARPQIGFGKKFGPVQLLMSAGAAIETRRNAGVAFIGGAHIHARVAPPVAIFVETDVYVKNVGRNGAPFTFDLVSFGLKFYPGMRDRNDDPLEISAAGHIPVAAQYTQYYLGSVHAQGNYFFPGN